MVTRPDRLIIRFADPLNGTPAAFAVNGLERLSSGRDVEVPMADISASDVDKYASQFALDGIAERDALLKDKEQLTKDIADKVAQLEGVSKELETTKQQLIDNDVNAKSLNETLSKRVSELDLEMVSLTSQLSLNKGTTERVIELESQLASSQQNETQLSSQVADKETQIASLLRQVDKLTATQIDLKKSVSDSTQAIKDRDERIARLLAEVPFDPRALNAVAFENRLTREQLKKLYTSDDPTTKTIADTVRLYVDNDYPVMLDSPEFKGMIGYLVQSGQLSEKESLALIRDASRDEAHTFNLN